MKHVLEPISLALLTYVESGELVARLLADVTTLNMKTIVQTPYTTYISGLNQRNSIFLKALQQPQGSTDTEPIFRADQERGRAFSVLKKAIKLATISDIAAEVEAARRVTMVLKQYKGIDRMNYEAETMSIDLLVDELAQSEHAPSVATLKLDRYITRLNTANTLFKTLLLGRATEIMERETFNTRVVRDDLMDYYREFTFYIMAMANATGDEPYVQLMAAINFTRKYYADMVARRKGKAAKKKSAKPAATPQAN